MSGVCKNWALFYFNSPTQFQTSLQRQSGSLGHLSSNTWTNFSCHGSQWMSEYWWTWKIYGGNLFPLFGRAGEEKPPLQSQGRSAPLSIFRIFGMKFRERYQSHFEVLGLHLFVRDVRCSPDDCANSSKATYSSYTPQSICLCCLAHRFLSIQVERSWLNLCSYFIYQFVNKMFWLFTITVLVNLCLRLKCNY